MTRESEHTCHALGCSKRVPPRMWGCPKHWRLVPADLQHELWATYRSGQENTMTPSAAYLRAAAACVQAVASREGFTADEIAAECDGYLTWAAMIEADQ